MQHIWEVDDRSIIRVLEEGSHGHVLIRGSLTVIGFVNWATHSPHIFDFPSSQRGLIIQHLPTPSNLQSDQMVDLNYKCKVVCNFYRVDAIS